MLWGPKLMEWKKSVVESLPRNVSQRKCLTRGIILRDQSLFQPFQGLGSTNLLINWKSNRNAASFGSPNPHIRRVVINVFQIGNKNIHIGTKEKRELKIIPITISAKIILIKIIKVKIHVNKCRLECNRNVTTLRIIKDRGTGGVDSFNPTIRLDSGRRPTETSEEPRTFRRDRVLPKIKMTIF